MSQIDLEIFQRLEEFSSYSSCIRSFGQSIIPPLVTPNHVLELRQLRAAAVSKETEILRRKKDHLREMKDDNTLSMFLENSYKPDFQSNVQESCALWYPSYHDNQEVSVAISKFPTSNIYSSVHTDSIVCSNIIGSDHAYNSNVVKDVMADSGTNINDCVECSHNNINLECSLCLEEWDQNLCSRSFPADLSPEVPCRTFSLLQNNDINVMEETECETLPTVMCNENQKNVQPDTDSESNTTCMTQSTDLEKYMELSCEFSSPDNSAVAWDSKTVSQQCTLSRSDDASSETIVNTENELTPCASTMAELTDNIEDEFSNAEEVAGISDNKEVTAGAMKRAHSVDSYMKIIQNRGNFLNVKKSYSEPFNANTISNSADITDKTIITSKTNLLIKEDSKESDEAKDAPEKDNVTKKSVEVSTKNDKVVEPEANVRQKKHVRQNSYTLDEPSSALILAHADCACNFDAKCYSPHGSALKDTSEAECNSAFVKEKVDIPTSHPHMQLLPILNSDKPSTCVNLNKEEISSAVIDIFPNVKEERCDKTDSANAGICINAGASDGKEDSTLDAEEYLSKRFLENLNLSNREKHQEYIEHICEELKASYELRVKELHELQNRQFLKLKEEFKEQEKLLYENLKIALEASKDLSSKYEEDLRTSNSNPCNESKLFEHKTVVQDELPASITSGSLSDQIPTFDNSSTQTSMLSISNKCSPSLSPSEMSVLPVSVRALSSSKDHQLSDRHNSSIPSEDIKTQQLVRDCNASIACLKNNEDTLYISRESMLDANGFSHASSLVPHINSLPYKYPSAIAVPIYNNCDKISTCLCDNAHCRCCMSFNGCSENVINSSHPYPILPSREHNFVSADNNISSHPDSLAIKKLSPCTGIQNKTMDSAHFSGSKINLPEKSNDYISTTQKTFENGESSSPKQDDKDKKSSLSLLVKESPINNLMSLYAEVSRNGSCMSQNATFNNKVNIDPNLLKKFEKLPAFVKGYLTRCLFNTKHVQNLVKTLKDTALMLGKMREDLTSRGDFVSQGDVDFHRQLIVLVMATYDNFYEIFFTISTKERMSIIAESRNFKLKQKSIAQDQGPSASITAKAPESASCKTYKVSSASLKVLERKKRPALDTKTYSVEDMRKARSRSVLDMKTYTIDDLPSFSGRAQSSMSSKGVSVSPSSVYKNSVGTSLKRKTASSKSSGSRGSVHQKWVP